MDLALYPQTLLTSVDQSSPQSSAWGRGGVGQFATPTRPLGPAASSSSRLSPLSQPYTPSPPSAAKIPYSYPSPFYAPVVSLAAPLGSGVLPSAPPGGVNTTTRRGEQKFADYHSVTPVSGSSDTFRAVLRSTGAFTLLKRVPGATTDPKAHHKVLKKWQWVRHPNLVPLQNIITTSALSSTAADECVAEFRYVADVMPIDTFRDVVSENVVWSTAVQMVSALRHAHGSGQSLRCLTPSKVSLGPWGRVHITGLGCADLVPTRDHSAAATDPAAQQAKDLEDLGNVLLAMCCTGQPTIALETLMACPHYTQGLKHFVLALLPPSSNRPSGIRTFNRVGYVCDLLGERVLEELSSATSSINSLLQQQVQQMNSGRALRVLVKMSLVLDRPENEKDPRWSETGDRFLLKLFRSYVFHQTDDVGSALCDWGHIGACLHKLDVGSEEKVILMTKDESTVVVTSYAEMRSLLETIFSELNDFPADKVPRVMPR